MHILNTMANMCFTRLLWPWCMSMIFCYCYSCVAKRMTEQYWIHVIIILISTNDAGACSDTSPEYGSVCGYSLVKIRVAVEIFIQSHYCMNEVPYLNHSLGKCTIWYHSAHLVRFRTGDHLSSISVGYGTIRGLPVAYDICNQRRLGQSIAYTNHENMPI